MRMRNHISAILARSVVVSLLFLAASRQFSQASQEVTPITFENAVGAADLVALGEIVHVPALADLDATLKVVIKRNDVRILDVYKGECGSHIAVRTLGGEYLDTTADPPKLM